MLEEVVLRYLEAATLQSRHAFFSQQTGISDRRLRDTSARFRPSTLARAEARSRQFANDWLGKGGVGERERQDYLARHPKSLTAGLVYEAAFVSRLEYPRTLVFAERIDALGAAFFEAQSANDLGRAKSLLLETDWLDHRYFSDTAAERSAGTPPVLLRKVIGATSWDELLRDIATVRANLLFSLLALWDIELRSRHLKRLQARAVFSLLLPFAHVPEGANEVRRTRGIFLLPVRRLLDLVFALAAFHPLRSWNVDRPSLEELAQRTNEEEPTLVNWRDGTKRFGWQDFDRVWDKTFRASRIEKIEPMAPLAPLFVAATIFQDLLVNVDSRIPAKEVLLVEEDYSEWWAFHAAGVEGARAEAKDASPWPTWLSHG